MQVVRKCLHNNKGQFYEINIYLCIDQKTEYGTFTETGAAVIRQRTHAENERVGTGKYARTGGAAGTSYAGCISTSTVLFFSDSTSWQRI